MSQKNMLIQGSISMHTIKEMKKSETYFCLNILLFLMRRFVSLLLLVKNLPANTGETGDVGSITGSGRSPGGVNSNPLQYS